MIEVLLCLIVGITIGVIFQKFVKFIKVSERVVTYLIYLLLLVLGISVGGDSKVMDNLSSLGVTALIIAVASVLGSVLLSMVVYLLWFKKGEEKKSQ